MSAAFVVGIIFFAGAGFWCAGITAAAAVAFITGNLLSDGDRNRANQSTSDCFGGSIRVFVRAVELSTGFGVAFAANLSVSESASGETRSVFGGSAFGSALSVSSAVFNVNFVAVAG